MFNLFGNAAPQRLTYEDLFKQAMSMVSRTEPMLLVIADSLTPQQRSEIKSSTTLPVEFLIAHGAKTEFTVINIERLASDWAYEVSQLANHLADELGMEINEFEN